MSKQFDAIIIGPGQSGPSLAVGMTEDQVRQSGRAVERGENQGFMKVLVNAETQEILGTAGTTADVPPPRDFPAGIMLKPDLILTSI